MSAVSPREFFEALYAGIGGGFIEIRPLLDKSDPEYKSPPGSKFEGKSRRFFDLARKEIPKAADYCLGLGAPDAKELRLHTYFGVGVRKDRKGGKTAIGCVPAAFTDVDFKHVPKDQVLERLKAFPIKPSIVVTSGNGVHVYWLLEEPVFQSAFHRLEEVNRRLLQMIGAQVGTQDVSRILRVPGTVNLKAEYPDPKPVTQVVRFEPDRRCDFEALAKLLITKESEKRRESAPETSQDAPGRAQIDPPTPAPPQSQTSPLEVASLPVSDFTKRIVLEGVPAYIEYRQATDPPERFEMRKRENKLTRSEADGHVVYQLLAAGLSDSKIYALYRDPRNHIGEKYRERKDGDKYLGTTIQKTKAFRLEHPRVPQNAAAERIGKTITRKFPDAQIEIPTITKINYQSPIYLVHSRLIETGDAVQTRCTEDELDSFKKFRKRFLVQNDRFPPFVTQQDWEILVNGAKFEIQEVDKELATVEAEIEASLDDWLSQAQSEVSETVLQYLPVHDQESDQVYVRLKAFMHYLTNERVDAKKRDIVQVVKRKGFHLETKRFGPSTAKVWVKTTQNGHPPTPKGGLFE